MKIYFNITAITFALVAQAASAATFTTVTNQAVTLTAVGTTTVSTATVPTITVQDGTVWMFNVGAPYTIKVAGVTVATSALKVGMSCTLSGYKNGLLKMNSVSSLSCS